MESWTRHFSILSDEEIFTFDPPLKSHQSIWSLIQAYYLIISIPNSKNWKYNNDWRLSFFYGWSKVPHRQNSIFRIGGKINLCSANHRICNIRYVLIKFSGYIAYDMQFNFYPRPVMAFGYCRCLRLSVCVYVCVCVRQSCVCPRDNSLPV